MSNKIITIKRIKIYEINILKMDCEKTFKKIYLKPLWEKQLRKTIKLILDDIEEKKDLEYKQTMTELCDQFSKLTI